MQGGLIQLTAYGSQDIFITCDTSFYKKHTSLMNTTWAKLLCASSVILTSVIVGLLL